MENKNCICCDINCSIPYGKCHCGCGKETILYTYNNATAGIVKGKPQRFIIGHRNIKKNEKVIALPFKLRGEYCRIIPLTNGMWSIVSAHRYDAIMEYRWKALWNSRSNCFYVVRDSLAGKGEQRREQIYMSRQIMGLKKFDKLTVDHIYTGNTLDNSDTNLRVATRSQQQHNKRKQANNTSGYKGVSEDKKMGGFNAFICVGRKRKWLGRYSTAIEASEAYSKASMEYHGEFGRTR